MNYKKLPRCPLGFLPTPIIELPRLSMHLDACQLFMKRDDQTGLGFGGNKTRKLEFLVADALERGCDTLITGGAEQSNHCRQTAAAAAKCSLSCHLVLGGQPPDLPSGNLLLDYFFGAEVHWTGEFRKGEKIPEIAQELKNKGKTPYIVPYGGSNTIGAAAFIEAMKELKEQLASMEAKVTHIVFPSSSGGTQAGLTLGKTIIGEQIKLIGIGIDKEEVGDSSLQQYVVDLTNQTAKHLEFDHKFELSDFIIREEFLGGGYGVLGEAERSAIYQTAMSEGILLDPVYTGRAMAGLIAMIKAGEFSHEETVLFWHTGGTPALFSYAADLLKVR